MKIFLLGALLSLCMYCYCSGQDLSIDELIASASSVSNLNYLTDLDGQTVMQEMDMVLTLDQWKELQVAEEEEKSDDPAGDNSRKKRKAVRNTRYRWTAKTIPYRIARGVFNSRGRNEIQKAMAEWQRYTCIRFTPASSHRNYVYFDNGSGCYSYVGMTGGSQTIGLAPGCRQKGVIVHEIGHAVGFHHEQNRPDRDNYVRILRQNIPQNLYYNFKKYPYSAVITDVPYDYGSIMHYGGRAFSTNGQLTIQTLNRADQNKIGNRRGLSFKDIKLANLMYSCNSGCSKDIKCPGEGFVGTDCNCYCPGNPVQRCSGTGGKTTRRPAVTTRRPTVTTKRPCRNLNSNCQAWAEGGYCRSSTYMKLYCKPACNLCSGGPTARVCTDEKEHCGYWKNEGFCRGEYKVFMKNNCKKSCGYCQASSISSSSNTNSSSSSSGNASSSSSGIGFEEVGQGNGSINLSAGFWAHLSCLAMLGVTFILSTFPPGC